MTDERLLQEFEALAQRLDIDVARTDLEGRPGGFCVIKGERRFILDRELDVRSQVQIFAREFGKLPLDDLFLKPAIRAIITDTGTAWV